MDGTVKKKDPLAILIAERKWKAALKQIENRQKKGDKSDDLIVRLKVFAWSYGFAYSFQVQKIIVLLEHSDETRQKAGRQQLDELCTRQPPLTDADALSALDIYLSKRSEISAIILKLWERAATVCGQKEEFLNTWFMIHFLQRRWPAAQKVR